MNDYFGDIGVWPRDSKGVGTRYIFGFVLSLLFTLGGYELVVHHAFTQPVLLASVIILAILQLIVQLECFLHLGSDLSTRARVVALGVALVIVAILISGSLWIMYNLSQRMMPSAEQMQEYMSDQSGL